MGVDLVRDGDAWRTLRHRHRVRMNGHCDGARYTTAEVCALATAQAAELRARADGAAAERAALRAQAEAACAQSVAREAQQRADAAALDLGQQPPGQQQQVQRELLIEQHAACALACPA